MADLPVSNKELKYTSTCFLKLKQQHKIYIWTHCYANLTLTSMHNIMLQLQGNVDMTCFFLYGSV